VHHRGNEPGDAPSSVRLIGYKWAPRIEPLVEYMLTPKG
jgi:hypothetical protein